MMDMNLIVIVPEVVPGEEQAAVMSHCRITDAKTGADLPVTDIKIHLPFPEGVTTATVTLNISGFRTMPLADLGEFSTRGSDGKRKRASK